MPTMNTSIKPIETAPIHQVFKEGDFLRDPTEGKGLRDQGTRPAQYIPRITQEMITPNAVKQRHIEARIIFTGLDKDKPTDGTTQKLAYFSTDTNKLSIFNGISWVSIILT